MANQRIWAPWRLDYVKDASKDNSDACVFCAALEAGDDEANLIVHRGERCFVILNKFPYTNGHLMVAPFEHVAALQELDAETIAEMMGLAQRGIEALESSYSPHGYNVGSTRAGSPAPASSTTSTCTSSRAGAATPTSCRCSATRA